MNTKKLFALITSGFFTKLGYSQIKLKDLTELEDGAKQAADTIQQISMYLNSAGIAIAAFFCIYFVATSHPKAKEYVIAIIAGLAIYLIVINVIF